MIPSRFLRRGVRDAHVLLLLAASRSVSSARPVMLMIAFIGVRISWLIIARNELLASVGRLGLLGRRLQALLRLLQRLDPLVERLGEVQHLAAPPRKAGPALEVARGQAPGGAEDRPHLAQEQELRHQPGHEERDEDSRREDAQVLEQGPPHGRAPRTERDSQGHRRRRWPGPRAPCSVARRGAPPRRRLGPTAPAGRPGAGEAARQEPYGLPHVLLVVHGAVLHDALVVHDVDDGAGGKPGALDEVVDPAHAEAREQHERRLSALVDDRRERR